MIAKLTIAALAAGLLATGAATTALADPTGTTATPVLTAFNAPLDLGHDNHDHDIPGRDNDNRHDNDHGRGWDGDRNHDGDWDGHDWHWWHDWGISVDLCQDGGGHVNWNQHRCEGGRFDDFHVR